MTDAPAGRARASMHLWPEAPTTGGLGIIRACQLERRDGEAGGAPATLWYSLPDLGGGEVIEPAEPFVIAALVQAMAERRDLVLHGAASAELLGNLSEFRDAWHRWRPQRYASIDVLADVVTPRGTPRQRGGGVVASYSGGVDSSFTIYRHLGRLAGPGSRCITHAVFVHGFDIPLEDAAGFDAAHRRAAPLLAALGVTLVPIRTNFREVLPFNWEMVYGPALAACFHLLRPNCGEALLPSSRAYDAFVFPAGSNSITDHLLSSAAFTIAEDGAGLSRCEKIALLAGWPDGIEALRVCWQGPERDRNCGRCEKCLRTMYGFVAVGLPVPRCFPVPPTVDQLQSVSLRPAVLLEEWQQVVNAAERHGITGKWVDVARRKVRRERLRRALRDAAGAVARATLPPGVRRLARQVVVR